MPNRDYSNAARRTPFKIHATPSNEEQRTLRAVADALDRAILFWQRLLANPNPAPSYTGRESPKPERTGPPYIARLIDHPDMSGKFILANSERVSWWLVRTLIESANIDHIDMLVAPNEDQDLGRLEREEIARRRLGFFNEWCRRESPPGH